MLGRDILNNSEIYNHIVKIVSENTTVLKDEPMSKHTSFKIGGNADIYVRVTTENDIKKILEYAKENNIEITIVGNGTNLLVRDNGIRGITIRIDINKIEIDNKAKSITVGAGVLLSYLAQILLKKEIAGFEFAAGIPGTIGGAIKMNAGAHGSEMKDIVISTKYINRNGDIYEISNAEHEFKYRNSIFESNDWIILETKLKLEKGNYDNIKSKMLEYMEYRKNTQPLEYPSAGSTFKRGKDFITAKLIDESGLKGYKINDAEVSTKHAGFIINKGKAKACDIIKLTEKVKEKVKEKYSKDIELEIQIIGE